MIDYDVFNDIYQSYIYDLKATLTNPYRYEIDKWKAVKTFQDNWDLNAVNFSAMFEKATKKALYLLDSGNHFPRRMILEFSQYDEDTVKKMFSVLYDETIDLVYRVDTFRALADDILTKIQNQGSDKKFNNHFQNTNAISTYLWLKYPDKYFIYRYSYCVHFCKMLHSSVIPKANGTVKSMLDAWSVYEVVREYLKKDKKLLGSLNSVLDDDCYPDLELNTLTTDIAHYSARYYDDEGWFPNHYNPEITTEKWVKLLNNKDVFNETGLIIVKSILDSGGYSSCKELREKYGKSDKYYLMGINRLAERVQQHTGCAMMEDNNAYAKWWPLLFMGKRGEEGYQYKLRDELKTALEKVDLSGIELYEKKHTDSYFLDLLLEKDEIVPDEHDGSYELIRETVKSYKHMNDLSMVDYRDINLIYLMTIGTWRHKVETKKSVVNDSHLPDIEKERLVKLLDGVWNKAKNKEYSNIEISDQPSVGMFGSGFFSFKSKITHNAQVVKFIQLCIEILDIDNPVEIYNKAEKVVNGSFSGMQAASVSAMLHCLKPYVFPVLNTNMGYGNQLDELGIELNNSGSIATYIDNCRVINDFMGKYNFKFRNYRVQDLFAVEIAEIKKYYEGFFPSLKEFYPGVGKEEWRKLLLDTGIFTDDEKSMLKQFWLEDGKITCNQIANQMGTTVSANNLLCGSIAKKVFENTHCRTYLDENEEIDKWWPILFIGKKDEKDRFIWKVRKEINDAFEDLNKKKVNNMKTDFALNTILYGPPGTGKTYNTVNYAVAICENKTVAEVQNEDYNEVIERYNSYRKDNRIMFTTFHQSYGYEEFIEGIKPEIDSDTGEMTYIREDGVFKDFCSAASKPSDEAVLTGISTYPTVWKVSLAGTGENEVRKECMDNNHIRIGWDNYGPDIADEIETIPQGRAVLNAFINTMQIGDVILSCFSSKTIDAIGIVTGDYKWKDEFSEYKRVRDVNWIAKDLNYDIVEMNNGKSMTLSTVYKLNVTVSDIMTILEDSGYKVDSGKVDKDIKNYVFIIDEINRGNISKIFGELITLIEPSKRTGNAEASYAVLPYSHKPFGVPNNVYILGTMNTADRSIALMDTALRRRFDFVEMMPDSTVLIDLQVHKLEEGDKTLDICRMLDVMNRRIELLYDREHTIGHSFFTALADDLKIDTLAVIFKSKIIPLLQEYFFDDYEKIQLILGDNAGDDDDCKFIIRKESRLNSLFKGNPDLDLEECYYVINDSAFYNLDSYIKIYE